MNRGCDAEVKRPVLLFEGWDGYFAAEGAIIPGCISQDSTVEEALTNIKEAAELCLERRDSEGLID